MSLDKTQLDRQEVCAVFVIFVTWLKHGMVDSVTLYFVQYDSVQCVKMYFQSCEVSISALLVMAFVLFLSVS